MKVYYYIHTGHRVGLDRLRRSAPVINALYDLGIEATLLTNDFRAGEYAKEQFGIRRYVSVDVVRNIANIATPGDALIFDSREEGRAMWEDMAEYFRVFVRIGDDEADRATKESGLLCPDVVDPRYFGRFAHEGGKVYFWGDADYEKELAALSEGFAGLGVTLLEGYYFFLQYTDELLGHFAGAADSEAYDEVLTGAGLFLTSSPQSALEALAAGSRPVYLPRPSAEGFWRQKLARFGIPVLDFSTLEEAEKLSQAAPYRPQLLRNDAAAEVASYIKDKLS